MPPRGRASGRASDYGSLADVGPCPPRGDAEARRAGDDGPPAASPGDGEAPALELRDLLEQLDAAGAVRGRVKGEQLMRADVIVSDVSGVTSEYLFTRRPAILPVTPRAPNSSCRGEDRDPSRVPVGLPVGRPIGRPPRPHRGAGAATTRSHRPVRPQPERLFRDHRTLEDAVRSFDLALLAAHSAPRTRVRFQRAYERSRAAALADAGRGPRVSSAGGDRIEGLSDRADGTAPEGGGVDGISRGDG